MPTTTRRQFGAQSLGSLLTYSLLETLFQRDAFASEIKPLAAAWLKEVHELGSDLHGQKLTQVAWQTQTERLFARANVPDLLKFIDYDKLSATFRFAERGERSVVPRFPAVAGLPTELVFGHQIFGLKKGRSVIPHGHDNMATAFLILNGKFHGRHYDRVEDQEDHLIIRPTINEKFGIGGCSTVSDVKDNVHWFKALTDQAFIFNIHVTNLKASIASRRVYVDPNGESLSENRIRARKIRFYEANKLYG